MSSVPRGRCLIINMSEFDKGEVPLHPRKGADKDVGQFFMFSSSVFLASLVGCRNAANLYVPLHFIKGRGLVSPVS